NEPLILMMPAKLRNSLEFNLNKPKNFYVTLENENAFRQNRFPIRNLPVAYITDGQQITDEVDLSTPPAAFTLFNASVGADLFKNLNLNFRINNVFNTNYKEYLNRLRYYMYEPGRNFVVTLKYNF
ncbi:TonB-dependent receptor, partial [Chryseobacterium sp. 2TAF14]